MTDYAKIGLIGKSSKTLLEEIESIRKWDNGANELIRVCIGESSYILDSIDNVETAIKGRLWEYIDNNFRIGNMILKSGGNDDLYLVPDPDKFNDEGKFHKVRHKPTNITPKKKKRKRR
jgi:hypothetical protein